MKLGTQHDRRVTRPGHGHFPNSPRGARFSLVASILSGETRSKCLAPTQCRFLPEDRLRQPR